jgi:hypothetical protein
VIDGLVEDLSKSGLFLRADLALDEGDEAELELEMLGEPPVHLSAEVVRVDGDGGMAFRFREQPSRPLANFLLRQYQTAAS